MKKSLYALGLTSVAAFALVAAPGLASAAAVPTTVPYSATSSDGGSCGNQWAIDLYNRVFSIPKADPAGNYAVVETFKNGHYSTSAGQSPGACNSGNPDNGNTVNEGVNGTFSGNEHLFVQGGTYSAKDGTCDGFPSSDPANPCTTASYVAYHYGAGATFTITTYSFTYNTSDKTTVLKKWTEVSTGGPEVDTGDIANTLGV